MSQLERINSTCTGYAPSHVLLFAAAGKCRVSVGFSWLALHPSADAAVTLHVSEHNYLPCALRRSGRCSRPASSWLARETFHGRQWRYEAASIFRCQSTSIKRNSGKHTRLVVGVSRHTLGCQFSLPCLTDNTLLCVRDVI